METKSVSFSSWLKQSPFCGWGVLVFSLLVFGVSCARQKEAQREEAYPKPRFPKYLVNAKKEELLEAARLAVRQSGGMSPLGKMQSGQIVYVLLQWGQDLQVWEAMKQAWAERGVQAREMWMWDVMGVSKQEYETKVQESLMHGNEAWKELGNFEPRYRQFFPAEVQKEFLEPLGDGYIRSHGLLVPYLEKHPEIQYFYAGGGAGGIWVRSIGEKHGKKYMGNWLYIRVQDLLSKAPEFPPDVWNLVEEKILEPTSFVSEVTFQDPQGTNLHWTLTPEEATYWANARSGRSDASNHISIYPSPLHSTLSEGAVVVATANHTGHFAQMSAYLSKHGKIERLEGGGKNGDLFRMLVENPTLKNAKFPGSPEPGYWFLRQDGYATNPKYVRNMAALVEGDPWTANLMERQRAGIQHLAFSYNIQDQDKEYAKTLGLDNMLWGHTAHMHVYFPTIRWKLRDTGEWITIGDKGYVKAFDDAEVRALGARYGDPDLLFRYEWIPSIPGVNVAGDYQRDFASDPWNWMLKEWEKIRAGTYEYYIGGYAIKGPPM
ncbi:MAG: hypothetical protein HY644_12745 [Acidobacteria bacterium]|nr:hypothetical protein [Acidobacteriota bacterium]